MNDRDADHGDENLSHRQILIIVAALMCGALLFTLNTSLVAVAIPTIVADLHGLADISWIVTAYLLAATAVAPLYGKFSDLYGRKRVYTVSIVLFVIGAVLCGLAQNMGQLIAGRVVQGAGGGGLLVGAFAILGEIVSPRERGRYLPYIQGVNSVGIVAGPAVGGLLVDHLSWRWAFFIFAPIGIVTLCIITVTLRLPTTPVAHRIDYLGSVLLVGAVCSLLLAAVWGGSRHPWGSPTILGLAGLGVVLLAAFIVQERRAPEPVVPLDLFRNQTMRVGALFIFLLTGATLGASLIVYSQYVQMVLGFAPSEAWVLNLPFAICSLSAGILVGRFIAKTGRYRMFPSIGGLMCVAALVGFALLGTGSPPVAFGAAAALLGIGLGGSQHVPLIAVQNSVDRNELGTATSSLQFFQQLGTTIGAAVFGSMFSKGLADRAHRLVEVGTSGDVLGEGRLAIRALPRESRDIALEIYAQSIRHVFLLAIPLVVIAVIVATRFRQQTLRTWSYAGRDAEKAETANDVAQASEQGVGLAIDGPVI